MTDVGSGNCSHDWRQIYLHEYALFRHKQHDFFYFAFFCTRCLAVKWVRVDETEAEAEAIRG
jgi:hypothetical protein